MKQSPFHHGFACLFAILGAVGFSATSMAAPYSIDSGTGTTSVGAGLPNWSCAVLNHFTAVANCENILSVSVVFGTARPIESAMVGGEPFTVVIWNDPDGNGNPSDATVLSSASGLVSVFNDNTTFQTTDIPPVTLTVGQSFFAGVYFQNYNVKFPVAVSNGYRPAESWISFNFDAPINLNSLSSANNFDTLETVVISSFTAMIRANGVRSLPPSVSTLPATPVAGTSATLNCRVYPNLSATTVTFEYGLSPSGPTTPVTVLGTFNGSGPEIASQAITELKPGRTYRYRAGATNGFGDALLPEDAPFGFLEFTTAPAAPTVTTLPASSVTHTSASLDGTVSANGDNTTVTFTYTGEDGVPHTVAASPSPVTTPDTPVSADLTGLLLPEKTYSFYATAANSLGTTMSTPVRSFTTPPDPAVVGAAEPLNPTITGGLLFGTVVQPDGGTLLFGAFNSVNGNTRKHIARLKPNGTLDLAFNPNTDDVVVCAAVMNDGKIFIGGNFTAVGGGTARSRLARLNADGTVDTTFGDPQVSHYVRSLAVQGDGAVLVGGDFFTLGVVNNFMGAKRNRIARITAAGALDAGFNPNADGSVYAIAPLTDGSGSVLLGGAFTHMGAAAKSYLAKVNGTIGSPLTYSGSAGNFVYSIALQRDGKALVGGLFTTMNSTTRNGLARLETTGALDMGFDPNVTGGEVRSLAVQTNGKILVGGSFTTVNGITLRNKLARLSSAGVADAFNPNAGGGEVYGVALQKDGRVQAAGNFTSVNGGPGYSGFALLSNETAFETLEKRSDTHIRLIRAASAPLASSVTFEKSIDSGTTWTALGTVRSAVATPDFILTGISPPLPETARLRALARTAGGYFSGSAGLTETVLDYDHQKPTVTAVSATDITANSAVFRSMVNAKGNTTDVFYNYSVNPAAYDHTVSGATVTGIAAGAADLPVYGLLPGTTYRFECVAVNIGGTVTVTGGNFTTLSNLNAIYNTGAEVPASGSSYTAWGRQVSFELNYHPTPGTTLMVVNNTGSAPIEGTFANLAQGQAVDLISDGVTYPFVAHYYGGTGNDLVLLWRNTRVLSWGWNNLSQLGNGNSTNQGIPGDVVPFDLLAGKTIVSLSGGTHHSVALCADGTIATWGDNLEGQLGNGDAVALSSSVPTAVERGFLPPGIHPVAVSAGGSHTLALFSNGQVYGWGDNEYGQVGNGSSVFDENLPASAAGALSGRRVIGISAGEYHSLAVCDDGFVAAWGLGDSGQLGNGDTGNQKSPVAVELFDVPPGEKIVAVAAGRWHSMALTNGGKVFTWGNNSSGQLGDDTTINQKSPILLGLTATAIYGGGTMHSLALRSDGKLVAWGSNTFGQLGTGAFVDSYTPKGVKNTWLSGQSLGNVAAGDEHNLALRSDGTLYVWGLGNEGRLGDNDTGIHSQPVQQPVDATALDPGDRWLSFSSGAACQHSLAIVAMSLAPAATTYGATPWSATEASLYGIVRAHGVPVDVFFGYGLTADYGTTVTATPATMNGTTPADAVANVSGLLPGTTYHYQVQAFQGVFAFALGGDRTFTTYTRLQMWREDWFRTTENTAEAANDADADRDGVSNLLEFAFGLDPQQNSSSQLPQSTLAGGQMIYQFTEPDTYMGLTYGAEWSPDLTPGSWLPLTDNGGGALHIFQLNTAGLPKAFMRLKVTYSGP